MLLNLIGEYSVSSYDRHDNDWYLTFTLNSLLAGGWLCHITLPSLKGIVVFCNMIVMRTICTWQVFKFLDLYSKAIFLYLIVIGKIGYWLLFHILELYDTGSIHPNDLYWEYMALFCNITWYYKRHNKSVFCGVDTVVWRTFIIRL